jgi:hypothetical protein
MTLGLRLPRVSLGSLESASRLRLFSQSAESRVYNPSRSKAYSTQPLSLPLLNVIRRPEHNIAYNSKQQNPIDIFTQKQLSYQLRTMASQSQRDVSNQSDISRSKMDKSGSFNRRPSSFRDTIEKGGEFEPEKGKCLCFCSS